MRIRLVVVEGPDLGRSLEFDGYNRIVLGRLGSPDIHGALPKDPYLSRHHVLLEMAGEACVARDLGSCNGMRVNGTRVELSVLEEGNTLRAGHSIFRVEFDRSFTTFAPEPEAPPPTVVLPGPRLQDYEDLEQIAEGALGVVYEARERVTGRTVALKMLRPEREIEEGAVAHFLREMDVWRHLRHKHVVRVYAVGRDREQLWIAMEYVDGPTLEEEVEMNGRLSLVDACRVGVHVLSALAYGHDQGIVHRDVKPANILLQGEAGGLAAKVTDYGLAKNFLDTGGAPLTITGDLKGTPSYMAPEQLLNAKDVGPAADVYSVGATLYWALTGRSHLDDGTRDPNRWSRLLEGDFLPLREHRPEAPDLLGEAVDRALARHPKRRLSSAPEMADRIRRAWGTL